MLGVIAGSTPRRVPALFQEAILADEALALLRAQLGSMPMRDLRLHDLVLEAGLAVDHSTWDTLYVAFAFTTVADQPSGGGRRSVRDIDVRPSRPGDGETADAAGSLGGVANRRTASGVPLSSVTGRL